MARKRQEKNTFGMWAFYVSLLIALVAGALGYNAGFVEGANVVLGWILVILGLIVGLLNITSRETPTFVVATLGLLISVGFLGDALRLLRLGSILYNIALFVAPAMFVVSLKAIYSFAKD